MMNEDKAHSKDTEGKKPTFPTYGFPKKMQDLFNWFSATHNDTPLTLIVPHALATIAAAMGKRYDLQFDSYKNYAASWFVTVADSSTGKTAPLDWFLRPLLDADKANFDAMIQTAGEGYFNGAAKCRYPQRIIQSSTKEAMYLIMQNSEDGNLISADEFGDFMEAQYSYTGGSPTAAAAFLNKMYSREPLYVNRKGSNPIRIEDPCLSLAGTIQTGVAQETFDRNGTHSLLKNGFVGRFNFSVSEDLPDPKDPDLTEDDLPLEEDGIMIREWADFINDVLATNVGSVRFSRAAKHFYDHWKFTIQTRQVNFRKSDPENSDRGYFCSILGKGLINVPRLAMIVEAARNYPHASTSNVVEEDSLSFAICVWESCFLPSALIVREEILKPTAPKWFNIKTVSKADFVREMFSRFPKIRDGLTVQEFAENLGMTRQNLYYLLGKAEEKEEI